MQLGVAISSLDSKTNPHAIFAFLEQIDLLFEDHFVLQTVMLDIALQVGT